MSALLNGIHDRSTVVQKQFAFALGHLVRVGGASSELFFIKFITLQVRSCVCKHAVLFVPSDCERQQCGEATAEAQQLVLGKRR